MAFNTTSPYKSGFCPSTEDTMTTITRHDMLTDLVSEEAFRIYMWVVFSFVAMTISLFGIVTNVINIICFVKQGLKDSVNVSLFGLAVSDLCSLVATFGACILFTPAFGDLTLPFDPEDVSYMVFGWPHILFVRVTSWITALITLERCLCITIPLKVKSIITPKRVAIIIAVVFVIIICSIIPIYYSNRLIAKFSPEKNRTILALVYIEDKVIIEQVSFAFNNVFIPLGAFLTVIVCTIILVIKMQNKSKWRLKCTALDKVIILSDRDQKVAQMVVMISTLFIVCFIPMSFAFIGMIFEPELAFAGEYENLSFFVVGIALVLESTNSAGNIFIYYRMSSRYKTAFRQLFLKNRPSDTN